MSDLVASWLRTVVPGLWSAVGGTALAWLVVHAPWAVELLALLNIDPTSAGFTAGVMALVLAAWYALWRRLEPSIPDWLTRVVLGSAKAPTYTGTSDGVHIVVNGAVPLDPAVLAAEIERQRRVSPSE